MTNDNTAHRTYWQTVWNRFKSHKLGIASLIVFIIFCLIGIYAPFLASSKPIFVQYRGEWYFPLFRYLFYKGFFTKAIDIFFNLLIFFVPLLIGSLFVFKKRKKIRNTSIITLIILQITLFFSILYFPEKDPAADVKLNKERQEIIQKNFVKKKKYSTNSWDFDLKYMNDYAKLNMVLNYQQQKEQNERFKKYEDSFRTTAEEKWIKEALQDKKAALIRGGTNPADLPPPEALKQMILKETPEDVLSKKTSMPTLWNLNQNHTKQQIRELQQYLDSNSKSSAGDNRSSDIARAKLNYILEKNQWLENESKKIKYKVMPLLRDFHWEDDAGGEQDLNRYVSWWELTRINRKDMLAGLIFGVRISLTVGITAVAIALLIGIPIGALAGYYGGRFDIIVSRLLEIWESMPVFFMLLMVVAITQSKSIFIIVAVIGIFSWPGFSRYIRGEFFKQRNLAYVEACRASGFNNSYIIFRHILPNAIPPLLTLFPFAIMGAITSEAGLSFLGLGEEGSCSWGVLMDEGRSAFPGESYLLWPPAILLTILLIAIALIGDALRDTLDPKLLR
jgi:peptide/nickel transport system permease protein